MAQLVLLASFPCEHPKVTGQVELQALGLQGRQLAGVPWACNMGGWSCRVVLVHPGGQMEEWGVALDPGPTFPPTSTSQEQGLSDGMTG